MKYGSALKVAIFLVSVFFSTTSFTLLSANSGRMHEYSMHKLKILYRGWLGLDVMLAYYMVGCSAAIYWF